MINESKTIIHIIVNDKNPKIVLLEFFPCCINIVSWCSFSKFD